MIEAERAEKFPKLVEGEGELGHSSTGTGTEGRAGGERAGAHAEARAEGRGNVAKKIAAAGAVAVAAYGSGGIGAEPAAAGLALRIDTLHRKAGQELHFFSLSGRKTQADSCATAQPFRGRDKKSSELPWPINPLAALQPKENRVPKTAAATLIRDAREQRT